MENRPATGGRWCARSATVAIEPPAHMKPGTSVFVLLSMVLGCCLPLACLRRDPRPAEGVGPMVEAPPFSIAVRLSPSAADRLRSIGETVDVVVYFDGDPLPGQGKYNPPMRPVYLGEAERLVDSNLV